MLTLLSLTVVFIVHFSSRTVGDVPLTPQYVTTFVGQNVTWECKVADDGTNDVEPPSWYYSREGSKNRTSLDGSYPKITFELKNTLVRIVNVSKQDEGRYSCVYGGNRCSSATLTVLSSYDGDVQPGITMCPSDVVHKIGDNAVLRGAILIEDKHDEPRWSRNHIQISRGQDVFSKETVDDRFSIASRHKGNADLIIRDVRSSDAGIYTLEHNMAPQSASAYLIVIDSSSSCKLDSTSSERQFKCTIHYSGNLDAKLSCNTEVVKTDINRTETGVVVNGIFSTTHASEWPLCWMAFNISRCGEQHSVYKWAVPFEHTTHSSIDAKWCENVRIIVIAACAIGCTMVFLAISIAVVIVHCRSTNTVNVVTKVERSLLEYQPDSKRTNESGCACIINDTVMRILSAATQCVRCITRHK